MKRSILLCLCCAVILTSSAQKRKAPPAAPAPPPAAASAPVATEGDSRYAQFRTGLIALVDDAPANFKHSIDTTKYEDKKEGFGRRYYESKVKMPGVQKVSIIASFGYTCSIVLGSAKSESDIGSAGEQVIKQIKECYPDFYYDAVRGKNDQVSVEIGRSFADGYEEAAIQLYYALDEKEQAYKLYLDIYGGQRTRFYTVPAPVDNSFGKAVKNIYSEIPKDYAGVKGEKHENKGVFSSVTYEITPMPDGAHDCSVTEGSMNFANGCNCRYYLGEKHDEAVLTFTKVKEAMIKTLGDPFVYTTEQQKMDMTVPKDAEMTVTFGVKKKKTYESGPLISLALVKGKDNRYSVNMLFHKFGF